MGVAYFYSVGGKLRLFIQCAYSFPWSFFHVFVDESQTIIVT